MLELLIDGTTPNQAPSDVELAAWIDTYELGVTSVRRTDARTRQVFTDREYGYIVELPTMEVVWRQQSLFTTPTIVDTMIDTFLTDFQ